MDIPESFTHDLYLKIATRANYLIRYQLYNNLKENKEKDPKSILNQINKDSITEEVCAYYKVPEDDNYILMLERAYYVFLKDKTFSERLQAISQTDNKLIDAILNGVEMPGMNNNELSDTKISVSFNL